MILFPDIAFRLPINGRSLKQVRSRYSNRVGKIPIVSNFTCAMLEAKQNVNHCLVGST